MKAQSRTNPWWAWDEWLLVKNHLYSSVYELQICCNDHFFAQVGSYASSTLSRRSDNELQLMYSLAVVRAVNGLADLGQQSYFAESVLSLATRVGLPAWFVELRHEATHNQMPSLTVLREAAQRLIGWYYSSYWLPQAEHLHSLSVQCIPSQLLQQESVKLPGGKPTTSVRVSVPGCSSSSSNGSTHLPSKKPQYFAVPALLSTPSDSLVRDVFAPMFIQTTLLQPTPSRPSESAMETALQTTFRRQCILWRETIAHLARDASYRCILATQLTCTAVSAVEQCLSSYVNENDDNNDGDGDGDGDNVHRKLNQWNGDASWKVKLAALWIRTILRRRNRDRQPGTVREAKSEVQALQTLLHRIRDMDAAAQSLLSCVTDLLVDHCAALDVKHDSGHAVSGGAWAGSESRSGAASSAGAEKSYTGREIQRSMWVRGSEREPLCERVRGEVDPVGDAVRQPEAPEDPEVIEAEEEEEDEEGEEGEEGCARKGNVECVIDIEAGVGVDRAVGAGAGSVPGVGLGLGLGLDVEARGLVEAGGLFLTAVPALASTTRASRGVHVPRLQSEKTLRATMDEETAEPDADAAAVGVSVGVDALPAPRPPALRSAPRSASALAPSASRKPGLDCGELSCDRTAGVRKRALAGANDARKKSKIGEANSSLCLLGIMETTVGLWPIGCCPGQLQSGTLYLLEQVHAD